MQYYSVVLFLTLLFFGCSKTINPSNTESTEIQKNRTFQFTYQVDLEPSDQKVELWFPIPKTNEVQNISNPILDSGSLFCEELIESVHLNHYYYCFSDTCLS